MANRRADVSAMMQNIATMPDGAGQAVKIRPKLPLERLYCEKTRSMPQ
jgi:hypothetical protein